MATGADGVDGTVDGVTELLFGDCAENNVAPALKALTV